MENLPDGGTPQDLPQEMRPSSGFANTYCRLWWNRPSTTLTRNFVDYDSFYDLYSDF